MWNHRILYHPSEKKGAGFFAVHEVYYDKNDAPNGCTTNPSTLSFDDMDEYHWLLKKLEIAGKKPILVYDTLEPYSTPQPTPAFVRLKMFVKNLVSRLRFTF